MWQLLHTVHITVVLLNGIMVIDCRAVRWRRAPRWPARWVEVCGYRFSLSVCTGLSILVWLMSPVPAHTLAAVSRETWARFSYSCASVTGSGHHSGRTHTHMLWQIVAMEASLPLRSFSASQNRRRGGRGMTAKQEEPHSWRHPAALITVPKEHVQVPFNSVSHHRRACGDDKLHTVRGLLTAPIVSHGQRWDEKIKLRILVKVPMKSNFRFLGLLVWIWIQDIYNNN